MKESTPDDIAVLCSHVNVDRSRYRVFSRETAKPGASSQGQADNAVGNGVALAEIAVEHAVHLQQVSALSDSEGPKLPSKLDPGSVHLAGVRLQEAAQNHKRFGQRRALRSILRDLEEVGSIENEHQAQRSLAEHTISVFAASGGAGATTVSATLARLFCRKHERTVIVDGRQDSVLPFYFGSRGGSHAGRSFVALQDASDAPIHILTRDIWDAGQKSVDASSSDWLKRGLSRLGAELDRGLIDVWPDLPVDVFNEFCAPGVSLVIAVPDLNSVVGVRKIAKYLEERELVSSPLYVLNKFDERQALHVEMLEWFERQFPQNPVITLRRTDETSEALAEGLTVIDYAPQSGIFEEYSKLAEMIWDVAEGRSTSGLAIANPLRNK